MTRRLDVPTDMSRSAPISFGVWAVAEWGAEIAMNAPTTSCPNCGGIPASTRVTPEGTTWAICSRCAFNYPMSATPSGPGAFGAPAYGPSPGGPGGFGAPAQGAFGAPAQGAFGAPAQGAFGAPAQGAFGAPAQGAFGAPSPGAFGAPSQGTFNPPSQGAFGAPAQGGFGAPAQPGFGAPAQGGFGAPAQGGFGVPVYPTPAAPPARSRPRGLMAFGCMPFLTMLPMIFLFSPRACSSMDDSHQVALDALRNCPRAHAALGDDIDAAWFGLHTGESSTGGGFGNASWSFAVTGSRGRGDFWYNAQMQGGEWRIVNASLEVDGETIQVPGGCGQLAVPAAPAAPIAAPSTSPAAPSAGPCDRMQACCDVAGSEQVLEGLCRSVSLVRTTPNADTTCQQLYDSAGRLLGATGRPIPAPCQPASP
jgi:hypothetical protein